MNIWNVLRWNFLHQACMHPCKHVIWKFLVKALQRLPDHFVKFWNYMQLYKVWNKGLVLLSVSLSWEYVYYILSLSYGWNETVMLQWKVNLGDAILVFLFLTLSWRRPSSYRNQSIDLLHKSMDWFLYDNGFRHEKVKFWNINSCSVV